MRLMKLPPTAASPAPPRRIEDDLEYQEFNGRFEAVNRHKDRLVVAELALPRNAPSESPAPLGRVKFQQQAREMWAYPPAADAPIPQDLGEIRFQRHLVEAVLELAANEGKRVTQAALERIREVRTPEWMETIRPLLIAIAEVDRRQRARNRLFSEIGIGPLGRMAMPMSEFEVIAQGFGSLGELVELAIEQGIISKKDIG